MTLQQTGPLGRYAFAPTGIALIAGSSVMLAGQAIRYLFATPSSDGLNGGISLLLPWLLLLTAGIVISVAGRGLSLSLTAASGALAGAFAAPLVIDRLPGLGIPEAVWVLGSGAGSEALQSISQGENAAMNIAKWVMALGMILLFIFLIVAAHQLAPLVLGPARRSAFGIDTTVLLTIFAFVALSIGINGGTEAWVANLSEPNVLGRFVEFNVRTYAWVIPVVLWTALMIRQGGALAVGVSAGLVVTFLILPAVIDWLGNSIGEARPLYSQGLDVLSPYVALDWTGAKPLLGGIAALLLIASLWWALGVQAGETRPQVRATSGSPANGLAVTAFILSWFPITAIPGIVLGHMAYDQVVESERPQRGLGLARWAIILGYISFGGAAAFLYLNFIRS